MLHRPLALCVPLLAAAALLAGCFASRGADEMRAARSHYDLGSAHLREGNPRMALESYLQARELDPDFPEIHNAIGLVLHNSFKRPEDAIAAYDKALALKPDYSEAWNNLGTVYLELGRYDDAVRCFEKALADILYKTPWVAELNLGWALHLKRANADALVHLERAVFLNPTFCQAWRNLGLVALDQDDVNRAADAFEQLTRHCPKEPEGFYRLGMTRMRQGRTDAARDALTRCAHSTEAEADHAYASECRDTLKLLD